jgi:hypothetical protein
MVMAAAAIKAFNAEFGGDGRHTTSRAAICPK